jgi:hypothetical protein
MSTKNSNNLSRIKPVALRLAAQCVYQLRHRVPPLKPSMFIDIPVISRHGGIQLVNQLLVRHQ